MCARLLLLHGAATRGILPTLIDGIVWVQADLGVTHRRDAARITSGETDEAVPSGAHPG